MYNKFSSLNEKMEGCEGANAPRKRHYLGVKTYVLTYVDTLVFA